MRCSLTSIAILSFLTINQPLHAQRLETTLQDGWHVQQGDPTGAETSTFKDNEWPFTKLPHVWNHGIESSTDAKETSNYRGPGWYRLALQTPEKTPSQRSFLRFEAAATVADTYFNDTKLGQHRGGFTAFTYEITDLIKAGTNALAVRVDNSNVGDVPPLSGDFTIFGGFYRPVHLITTGPLCISPLVHGSNGIRIRQSNVSQKQATITVTTSVSNKSTDPFIVITSIVDDKGETVAQIESKHESADASAEQSLTLKNPHLWDSIADPYLYTVKVELKAKDQIVDSITEPLGLRFFNFDKDKGFSLNGHPYRLRGVCRHQDFSDKGWAASKEDMEVDIKLIHEMGANAVRLAHYPHSSDFLQLCDRYGIIAWSEIPLVDIIGKTDEFDQNAAQQIEEMIAQLGNHPSIVTWGLWNELQGGKPAQPVIQKLSDLAHQLDPTRPTTAASFSGSEKFCPDATKVTDLLATNTYPGWYRSTPEGMNDNLDKFHTFAPNQPLGVSEYGAGASIQQHEQGMTKAPAPRGPWHPEEWQAIVHEANWKAIEKRQFIWGSFIWNMFDFASARRKEGDTPGINDKGLVTRDRKVKKDAFFFYKASWSTEPVVYITSRRHLIRNQEKTPVKIYSNADKVQLTLNGKELPPAQHDGVIFQWPEITLKQGENTVIATAVHEGKTITDQVTWTFDSSAVSPPQH